MSPVTRHKPADSGVKHIDYSSPVGLLRIALRDGVITEVDFLGKKSPKITSSQEKQETRIRKQLDNYFSHRQKHFSLFLDAKGTAFQQRVWNVLQAIPYGQVRSYGDIARQLQSSAQAVGNACRANPIALIIPCHRVVARQGIGGFAGQTSGSKIGIKTWLLEHESVDLSQLRKPG